MQQIGWRCCFVVLVVVVSIVVLHHHNHHRRRCLCCCFFIQHLPSFFCRGKEERGLSGYLAIWPREREWEWRGSGSAKEGKKDGWMDGHQKECEGEIITPHRTASRIGINSINISRYLTTYHTLLHFTVLTALTISSIQARPSITASVSASVAVF